MTGKPYTLGGLVGDHDELIRARPVASRRIGAPTRSTTLGGLVTGRRDDDTDRSARRLPPRDPAGRFRTRHELDDEE